MKEHLIILFSLFSCILAISYVLKCGEEHIDNCVKCDMENSYSCATCKPYHFLFFHNLICLPCDDEIYGQVGCGGNCDGTRYNETRMVFCEKDGCKEGYFNLNGICFRCADGSPGCKKCEIEEKNDTEIYKCNECLSNEFRLSSDLGVCLPCRMDFCLRCHFNEDYSKTECDKCIFKYYLDPEKKCKRCKYIGIENGVCRVCSENNTDFNSGPCWCYSGYTKSSHSTCVKCPDNCPFCKYNKEANQTECIRCKIGYTLNPEKTCTSCGDGCEYCFLGENLKPICSFCFSRTFIPGSRNCLVCPDNCRRCELDINDNIICTECKNRNALFHNKTCHNCPDGCNTCYAREDNKINCLYCDYGYALNSDYKCTNCHNIPEIGGSGCKECRYNQETKNYECITCETGNCNEEIFAYILNKFQCLSNTDRNQEYLYGCLTANFIEEKNIYDCLSCKTSYNFIPIINKNICKNRNEIGLNNCEEAEEIRDENNNTIYSCIKCNSNYAKIFTLQNITKCKYKEKNLIYCFEGIELENNIFRCTKCVNNSHLNNSICECNSDSFDRYNQKKLCYKCDDRDYGNPGCEASEGCQYYIPNSRLDCNKCKSNYFSYTKGQCYSCSNEIPNCNKCHYDNSTEKLVCDNCRDDDFHYFLNRESNTCELNDCEEYPEISPGCIICNDKLDIYKPQKRCQSCKLGYFQIKDGSCVFCRSEKYGGPACLECGYEKDENNQETEKIKCKACNYYQALSSDGKCYDCKFDVSDGCQECKFIKNEIDNSEKLMCTACNTGTF